MITTTFIFFVAIIIGTLLITYWAAKQTSSTHEYYAAGSQLTGFQNGLAIAGDYLSAASFLGVSGTIAIYGFDGFFYSLGFLVSHLFLLLLIAEPVRNLGQFTMGDVICARFPTRAIRSLISISTLFISILYMVAQLVAAGILVNLLLDVSYIVSVIIVGLLMTVYVVFGGMMATSWVQIVKTVLLVTSTFMFSLLVLSRFDWSLMQIFEHIAVQTPLGENFLHPGNLFTDPLDTLSLNLALVLGTAGFPHILVRCLTVKDAITARKSVVSAIFVLFFFYPLVIILGLGTVFFVGRESLLETDPSGNMAAPLLAYALGGDFLMAFISAVAFATLLAVICGVVIAASSSIAHDFYKHVLCKGNASEKDQMRVAKVSAIIVSLISTLLAVGLKSFNAAVIVSLIFCIAASVHFPVLLLSIYWRRFTHVGVIAAMVTGLLSSIGLMILSPNMSGLYATLHVEHSFFQLNNPGIITIPLSFLAAYIGSRLTPRLVDEDHFVRIRWRAHTGIKEL